MPDNQQATEEDFATVVRPRIEATIDRLIELGVPEHVVAPIRKFLDKRSDPRCTVDVGSRPGWMSPDQYDPCRCTLPKDHEGAHACAHTLAKADK